jgi:DNA-binding NarL/FixJ family response regulator
MPVDTDVVEGRVRLVCRPELLRLGIERLLAQDTGLTVDSHAALPSGAQAAAVVVLCERGGGDLAAAVTNALDRVGREVVVVLSVPDVHNLLDCVAAGASGLVLEGDARADLLAAVRAAAARESFVAPSLLGLLLAFLRAERSRAGGADRTLLRLLAGGRPTAEIAAALGVAPKTVRNRSSRLYRRLGVRSRAQAVEAAERRGLLD